MVRSVKASSSTTSSEYGIVLLSAHQLFFRLRRRASHLPQRQIEPHGRAAIGHALHFHLSVMVSHVGLTDAQAQSGSHAAFCGEERLEDARQNLRGNPTAGVGDADFYAVLELGFFGAYR